jgi:MBG domain (YGX type)
MSTDTTPTPSVTISYSRPLTIAANPKTMTYGGSLPTFDASYSGFVNGDTSSLRQLVLSDHLHIQGRRGIRVYADTVERPVGIW